MAWAKNNQADMTERLVCAACYLTGGIAGIIYIVITRSQSQSNFFRFHFLQAIVLAILYMLIQYCFAALTSLLGPVLMWISGALSAIIPASLLSMTGGALGFAAVAFMTLYGLLFVYGLIFAVLGKYCEIPLISNIVRDRMH